MRTLLATIVLGLLLTNCTNESVKTDNLPVGEVSGKLPKANGKPGQALISIDNDLWAGEIEAVFKSVFSEPAQGPYIYSEPIFDFIQEDPSTINKTRKKHRNFMRIILEEDDKLTNTEIQVKRNNYSNGQLYVQIRDSKKERLIDFLKKDLKTYVLLFDEEETDRLVAQYKNAPHLLFNETAKERFGISISVPQSAKFKADLDHIIYALDKSADEVTKDNPKTGAKGGTYWSQRGILVWDSPYEGKESMTPENIMALRDSVLKKYVQGTEKDAYMTTEYYPTHKPTLQYINIDGNEAVKIEGLWKQAGNPEALGGGPFVQYSFRHPTRNRVIHANAHIFAPRFDKREYIRQIRAILKTIEILD
ncbi:MAG: DUF4837 family protein [Putridiphycobacter sp.]